MWNSGKSYLHNYHSIFSFFKHHFYQLFHSPGCFTVPDGQLLILTIRDNGVRLCTNLCYPCLSQYFTPTPSTTILLTASIARIDNQHIRNSPWRNYQKKQEVIRREPRHRTSKVEEQIGFDYRILASNRFSVSSATSITPSGIPNSTPAPSASGFLLLQKSGKESKYKR